jgi:hypothetical protein
MLFLNFNIGISNIMAIEFENSLIALSISSTTMNSEIDLEELPECLDLST